MCIKTVLSIGAHPDDIEIGCGGTEILLRDKGYSVVHVILTDGEEGSQSMALQDLAKVRQKEALKSAQVIGAKEVLFLGYEDGLTFYTKEMKLELIKIIRHIRPEIVFTHARSDSFPDHSIAHHLTMSALAGAKGPWYPRAEDPPHSVKEIFGYEVWNPMASHQMVVDITPSFERKVQALKLHDSQVKSVDYLPAVKGLAQYRGAMTLIGDFAEVFEVMSVRSVV